MELEFPGSELNHWCFMFHFGVTGSGFGKDPRAGVGHFCSSVLWVPGSW